MPFTCKKCGGSIYQHSNSGIWAKCLWCQHYDGKYEIIMEEKKPVENIDETLKERGINHGKFVDNGTTAQKLKDVVRTVGSDGVLHWNKLRPTQKEALDMILHKIARILSGDPNFHDHWHDICGYSKLAADELLE